MGKSKTRIFIGESEQALRALAKICDAGSRSGWPSTKPWANSDAWQGAYVLLAARIREGKVDLTRPLHGLARQTARNLFLDECRRERRICAIADDQIDRYGAGTGRSPEEWAEAFRRGEVLRGGLIRLVGKGKLDENDLVILTRRYVDDWSAGEVATVTGLETENVRQICTRRRRLLRSELAGLELEDAPG